MGKRIFIVCLIVMGSIGMKAQQDFEYGIANRLGLGVSASTEGIGFDVSTCLTKYLSVRAGIDIMPGFNINTDVNVSGTTNGQPYSGSMAVKGSLSRTTASVKFDCYPFGNSSSFFVTAGASFAGDKLVKISGHSEELKQLVNEGNSMGIDIGEYQIPVDKNGDVAGGVKVSGFRPYFGLGFGRLIPKNRVGFRFELGAQIHGTPKAYADGVGDLQKILDEAGDDDISDLMDKLTVYPVIKFSLRGRIL